VLRIGATRPLALDVRFIAATHRDLQAEVDTGRFPSRPAVPDRRLPVAAEAIRGSVPRSGRRYAISRQGLHASRRRFERALALYEAAKNELTMATRPIRMIAGSCNRPLAMPTHLRLVAIVPVPAPSPLP
jgi:hypothetical protein